MELIRLLVLIWVAGFWLTLAALLWAETQRGGGIGPWRAFGAAMLWFITVPLALVVIARLRRR